MLAATWVACFATFAHSLIPDQDQQNIGPGLDPSRLTLIVFQKEFFERLILGEKVSRREQKHEKLPSIQSVKLY